jgi:uncharacterized protein (DUF2141 family)
MDSSTIRQPAIAPTVRSTTMRAPMGVQCGAWLVALVLATLPALASGQPSCPGIHVKILNIRNSTGTVACALFESPDGFPTDYLRTATNVMVIKIRKDRARCDFEDIPPGTYAMAVIHDENMNGKLDTNRVGVPTEGYGFSNDAKGVLGPPRFSAASFSYNGRNLELTMSLRY